MEKTDLVAECISENVKRGIWKKGDRIYSEPDWAKRLGVSRNTVREALSVLIEKGAIRKKVGSGSYIEDVSFFKDKKCIIISLSDFYVTDLTGGPYKTVLNYLREYIYAQGYEPLVFIHNLYEKPIIKVDVTEVAGVITYFGMEKVDERFINAGIPVVSVMGCSPGCYPSTILDYSSFYIMLNNLIKKYKWKDVLFFTFERKLFNRNETAENDTDVFVHLAMEDYLAGKYKMERLPYFNTLSTVSSALNKFRNIMNSMDKIPDAVIFNDDFIYKNAYSLFFEFEEIMTKTNLITFSSGDIDINNKFCPCTVGFDLKKLAEKCVDMLMNYITDRYLGETCRKIEPYIYNEEVLK